MARPRGDKRRIVDFSRRIDCAPFVDWFIRRVQEGVVYGVNPYTKKPYRVRITTDAVKLVILWTKAPLAIVEFVKYLKARGFEVAVFATMNDYPKWLEPRVPSFESAVTGARAIGAEIGVDAVWWRFDPIIPTDKMDLAWYRDHVERLAENLKGSVSRCITSVVHTDGPAKYTRCGAALDEVTKKNGQTYRRLANRMEKIRFVGELSDVVHGVMGVDLEVCCHPFLSNSHVDAVQAAKWKNHLVSPEDEALVASYPHLAPGQCISTPALCSLGVEGDKKDGSFSVGSKRKGNIRCDLGKCLCRKSVDVGGDVPCPHGCEYCQWLHSDGVVPAVDPDSPWLSLRPFPEG